MGTVGTKAGGQAFGHFEPVTLTQLLPKCPGCGDPHPRATKAASDNCPNCGTFCPSGQVNTEPAALTGNDPAMLAARFFLWAGRALARLAGSN